MHAQGHTSCVRFSATTSSGTCVSSAVRRRSGFWFSGFDVAVRLYGSAGAVWVLAPIPALTSPTPPGRRGCASRLRLRGNAGGDGGHDGRDAFRESFESFPGIGEERLETRVGILGVDGQHGSAGAKVRVAVYDSRRVQHGSRLGVPQTDEGPYVRVVVRHSVLRPETGR